MIHPGLNTSAPFEIIDVLKHSGAKLEKTVIGHLDRTIFDIEDFVRLVETGCIAELDLFGEECSYYQVCTSYHWSEFVYASVLHYSFLMILICPVMLKGLIS